MKYTQEVILEVPLNTCIEKFSFLNLKHWHRNLESVEHVSGTPDEFGARMKLNFKGRNPRPVTQTLIHKKYPHETHCNYVMDGLLYVQENYFKAVSESHTKWTNVNEFTPLNFKMRMMLLLMPILFKRKTVDYTFAFKNFAEKGVSVCEN